MIAILLVHGCYMANVEFYYRIALPFPSGFIISSTHRFWFPTNFVSRKNVLNLISQKNIELSMCKSSYSYMRGSIESEFHGNAQTETFDIKPNHHHSTRFCFFYTFMAFISNFGYSRASFDWLKCIRFLVHTNEIRTALRHQSSAKPRHE